MVTCGFLESPGNGTKNGSSPLAGSVVKFSCNDGFILDGSAQRTCTEAGTWDGVDTKCIGELFFLLRPHAYPQGAEAGGIAGREREPC